MQYRIYCAKHLESGVQRADECLQIFFKKQLSLRILWLAAWYSEVEDSCFKACVSTFSSLCRLPVMWTWTWHQHPAKAPRITSSVFLCAMLLIHGTGSHGIRPPCSQFPSISWAAVVGWCRSGICRPEQKASWRLETDPQNIEVVSEGNSSPTRPLDLIKCVGGYLDQCVCVCVTLYCTLTISSDTLSWLLSNKYKQNQWKTVFFQRKNKKKPF